MIDTGFDWMLAPLVGLLLLGGMLLSMEAGMRLRARYVRAAQSDSTGFTAVHGAVFGGLHLGTAAHLGGRHLEQPPPLGGQSPSDCAGCQWASGAPCRRIRRADSRFAPRAVPRPFLTNLELHPHGSV